MVKLTCCIALLSTFLYAQYQRNYSVMDTYCADFVFSEKSVNRNINYPGLFKDSTSSLSIGFLDNENYTDNLSSNKLVI